MTPGALWGKWGQWGRRHLPSPQQAGVCAHGGRAAAGEPAMLPVFSAKVKAEVLMQRFLKLCRRGRIGRKPTSS